MDVAINDEVSIEETSNDDRGLAHGDAMIGTKRRRGSSISTHVPDGGWGWFIALSAFLNVAFFDGTFAAVSVLLVALKDYFEEGAGKVSLIASLGLFVFLCSSPISSSLGEYAGEKRVATIGALMSFAGLFFSGFVTDLSVLYFTLSFLTNFGFSLSFLPTFALLGKYFQKRHGLANGLATGGYGLGVMGLPPICQLLIQRYGWRGAVIILSGMSANLCVAAALLRPLNVREKLIKDSSHNTPDREHLCLRFVRLFGFHIICSQPSIIGIMLAMTFFGSSNGTFLTFFMQRADDTGIDRMDASLLMTVFGASSCLIRLTHGCFIDLRIVSPVCVLIGSIFSWAILLLVFVFVMNYWGIMTLCVFLGLTNGLSNALPYVVFKDAVERQFIANAYGLFLFSYGIGNFIGISISGALYDSTGTSDVTIYSAAICGFISAVILTITKVFGKISHKPIVFHNADRLSENDDNHQL
ncbi:monocarboxylate transporter 13-like [Ptychodera flava]|uniref:monocarboxylate transporter 13-like n=1 Tax=Ptychodera flava TaxID=63121 RepID=UPI003969E8F6